MGILWLLPTLIAKPDKIYGAYIQLVFFSFYSLTDVLEYIWANACVTVDNTLAGQIKRSDGQFTNGCLNTN